MPARAATGSGSGSDGGTGDDGGERRRPGGGRGSDGRGPLAGAEEDMDVRVGRDSDADLDAQPANSAQRDALDDDDDGDGDGALIRMRRAGTGGHQPDLRTNVERGGNRRPRRVSPEQLAYFLALCDARGNRTVAARALGVSQPAVSHAMRVLEEMFQLPLLDERGDPTEAGVLLRMTALNVRDDLDQLERDMLELREGQQSALMIAASVTVGERRLPPLLRDFHQAFPDVALEVVVGNYDVLLATLTRDQVDFGILGKRPPTREYFSYPIFPEDMVAFVATEPSDARLRALLGMGAIDPASLAAHTFVMRERDSGSSEFALECLARVGFVPEMPIHLGSNEAVRRFVGAGIGIGLLPRSAVQEELHAEEPTVQELHLQPWHNVRAQWLVARRDRERSFATQQFLNMLPLPDDVKHGDWRHDYPF